MKKLALFLLAGSALMAPAAAQTNGTPFGTVCPAALPLGAPFANTASAPTGTTLNIWDGTQCVPWATLNQTAHSITINSSPAGAALTRTNDTNVTLTLGGTPATALLQATSITAGWAGTLAVARGGTGGGSASGTLLDNISGFSGTGFLTRTGSGTYAFQSATNGVTLGNLAQSSANTMLGNWTGSTANVAANAMPACADSGGNHLNYVSGTGVTCGTATGAAAAGSLTGTTLASNVVTSSLTTVGTIGTGTWQGTAVTIGSGGTGQTSASAAFNALSPLTTAGDTVYGGVSGVGTRLAAGSSGQLLHSGTTPSWSAVALTDHATQVANTVVGNGTGSTAAPTALAVGSCSTAGSALIWTTNIGFGCNTSITAAAAPASGLTGTTLASNVVTSSLTTVGTIGTGGWQGTPVTGAFGGTGLSTAAVGDIMYASATTPVWARLADVATGSVLVSGGTSTAPAWSANPTVSTITAGVGATGTPSHIVGNSTTGLYSVSTTGFGITVNGTTRGDYGITAASDWTFLPAGTGSPLTIRAGGTTSQVTLDVVAGQGNANYIRSASNLIPDSDNNYSLGVSGGRWGALYIVAGTGTNADFLCLSAAGLVLLQTTACTISSLRFKPDWKLYEPSGMDTVRQLEIGTFHLADSLAADNRDPNARSLQIGLNAENVARVLPEAAVYEDDMTTPKSYRQESIIALYAKALQELSADITSLRSQFDDYRSAHP